MPSVILLAGGIGLIFATGTLWLQKRQRVDRRFFAALVAIAVTLSLFSLVAWVATTVARVAPLLLAWGFVGTLALMFALRVYRELRVPPPNEPR
jgi:hypothetical protein